MTAALTRVGGAVEGVTGALAVFGLAFEAHNVILVLHSTADTADEVQCGLLLDVVVRQSASVL